MYKRSIKNGLHINCRKWQLIICQIQSFITDGASIIPLGLGRVLYFKQDELSETVFRTSKQLFMKSTINILQIKTQSTLKFFKTFILGQVTVD